MLASGVSEYIHRYGVLPGSRAVVFTNNDSAYRTAFDLADAGAKVEAIVDSRPAGHRSSEARERGLEVIHRHAVVDVRGTKRIRGVQLMTLSGDAGSVSGRGRRLECDLLAVSGGWSPTVQLHAQSGARPVFDAGKACFVPGISFQAERSAGACGGSFELRDCLAEGFRAGAEAAHAAGHGDGHPSRPIPSVDVREGDPIQPLWIVPGGQARFAGPQAVRGPPHGRLLRRHPDRGAGGLRFHRVRQALHQPGHGSPTRAGWATSTASPSWRAIAASTPAPSAPRPFVPCTLPSPSGPSREGSSGTCSIPSVRRPSTGGTSSKALSSRPWANGSGPGTSRGRASRCTRRSTGSVWRCAAAPESWTPRRWGRSTSRVPTPTSF